MSYKIGRAKAIELFDSGWWESKTAREICEFQLFTEELAIPFGKFQAAMAEALGRPVWTHEFGLNYDGLVKEFLGEKERPSFAEIVALIPAENLIVLAS